MQFLTKFSVRFCSQSERLLLIRTWSLFSLLPLLQGLTMLRGVVVPRIFRCQTSLRIFRRLVDFRARSRSRTRRVNERRAVVVANAFSGFAVYALLMVSVTYLVSLCRFRLCRFSTESPNDLCVVDL